jgi:hypothetical protein
MPLNGRLEAEETPVTATVWCLEGYKFTLHLMSITISHPSLLLALGFFSFLSSANHQWRTKKVSSVSGLLLQREVLYLTIQKLHYRCHPDIHLHRGPHQRSRRAAAAHQCSSRVVPRGNPVSGPSSLVVHTSCDEEFARKLFGDLNCDILRPHGDGKIIIIDDSNDDDEAQEEGTTDIEPTTVLASAADAPTGARVANSDDQGSYQEVDGGDNNRRSAGET